MMQLSLFKSSLEFFSTNEWSNYRNLLTSVNLRRSKCQEAFKFIVIKIIFFRSFETILFTAIYILVIYWFADWTAVISKNFLIPKSR